MQKLAVRLTNYVVCKGVVKEEERKVYEYGFQTGLEVSLSFLISILIAVLGHMLLEGLLFLAIFIPLRSYAGGMHLKHYSYCLILSNITYTGILLLVKLIAVPMLFSILLLFAFIVAVWVLYPVKHMNRPIDRSEEIYFKKQLKQYLLIDAALAIVFLIFKNDKYLFLIMITFLLMVITMLIGKYKEWH
ncbi:accessory gene regulator B family protein [Lacrimispora sp. BS-2]|uniref:Accessory gene regulator B family protein n=1 Tax=Lacrimispora sp. BS-2 TaxID=3151850 RepID=A0AAU7PLB0_9FIRM